MKKVVKYILAVLSTAWTGALTIYAGLMIFGWLTNLTENLSIGGTFAGVILVVFLITITLVVGSSVRDKLKK